MTGIIISEKKKSNMLRACENLDPLRALPEKLLQAQLLSIMLSKDEIEANMLYKCGCPCDWIESKDPCVRILAGKKKGPKYSNECSLCWLKQITEEAKELDEYAHYNQELHEKINQYERFRLTPEQLEEILAALSWNQTYDFDSFIKKVKELVRN